MLEYGMRLVLSECQTTSTADMCVIFKIGRVKYLCLFAP